MCVCVCVCVCVYDVECNICERKCMVHHNVTEKKTVAMYSAWIGHPTLFVSVIGANLVSFYGGGRQGVGQALLELDSPVCRLRR